MAYSIVTHPGDGSTTTFPINFTLGFISRDDVRCRVGSEVDGLNQPIYRALTWITDGLVQVQGAPAALGVNLEFTRTVDKDQLIHDYSDGAAITESNLDDSNKQVIMMLHEFLDDRIRVLPTTNLDMNSYRITNLADGTDAQDAVTVHQAAQAVALTPVAVQAASDAAAALIAAEAAQADAESAQAAAEAAAASATGVLVNAMLKSQNLNDVASKATSRTNLDVYSKSEANTLFNLPSQTGNSGKYLQTNGTTPSWMDVSVLPSQTGNAGKVLGTNGTVAAWETKLFSTEFTSSEQSYTATNQNISVAHGLGGIPKFYRVFLRCKTAEIGYSVNDEVDMSMCVDGGNASNMINVGANATNIWISKYPSLYIIYKDGSTAAVTTPANWRLVFKAWI